MTDTWNAKSYSQFLDLRTQSARDLLAAIPASFQPKIVYDLGCGPGNSTTLLKERWPEAKIVGIDSSADMLKEAKRTYPDIDFIEGDIANFSPQEKIDCLYANASLQWVDDHAMLFPKLLQLLNSGGVFAIQIPNNYHCPTHQTIVNVLTNHVAWQPFLKYLRYGIRIEPLYKLTWYYDLLIQAGVQSLRLWETEYFQEMSHYQDIFDWVKGTVLGPILSVMDAKTRDEFTCTYIKEIAKEYPLQVNQKILLPFKRIFMVSFK